MVSKKKQRQPQANPPRKGAKKRTRKRRGNGMRVPNSFPSNRLRLAAQQMCSQINPFCPEAIGARVLDDDVQSTLPFMHQYSTAPYKTDGLAGQNDGNFFVVLQVAFGSTAVQRAVQYAGASDWSGSVNGTVIANGLVDSTAVTTISAFDELRCVSAGHRITISSPTTAAAGLVSIKRLPVQATADILGLATYAASTFWPDHQNVSGHNLELHLIHEVSSTKARHAYNNATTAAVSVGFDTFLVWGLGWPTDTNIQIDSRYNLEGIPLYTNVAREFVTPSPSTKSWAPAFGTFMNRAAKVLTAVMSIEHINDVTERLAQDVLLAGGEQLLRLL
jgi:hypothetical protein